MREVKLVVALLIGLSTFHLIAQEEPIYELEEVVVTATRIRDPLKDIPWGTEVITEEEISVRSLFGMDGVLRGEPGIDIRSYGGGWALSTVGLRGSSSSQVLLMLDSRPLNWVPLGVGDLGLLDPHMIHRVEVVKGPISSLYGANGLGGVVNIITRDPTPGLKYWSRASFGSPWRFTTGAGMSYQHSRLGLLAGVGQGRVQGIRTNSQSSFGQAGGKFSLQASANHQLKVGFGYHTRDLGLPGPMPPKGVSPKYGDSTATSRFDRENDTTLFVDFTTESRLSRRLFLSTRLYHDRRSTGFFAVYDAWDPEEFRIIEAELHDHYKTRSWGGSGILSVEPILVERLLFGFDWRLDRFEARSELKDRATHRTVSETEWGPLDSLAGIWGELKLRPVGPTLGLLAIRYDWNCEYGGSLSPTFGLIVTPNRSSRVRVSLGQAFRAPTLNDRYWPGAGNPELRPEIGRSLEVGLDYEPKPWLYLSGAGFGRKTHNLIAWIPDTAGRWRPVNIDQATIFGSELKLKLKPHDAVTVGIEATILSGEQRRVEVVYFDPVTGKTRTEAKTRPAAIIPRQTVSGDLRIRPRSGSGISLRGVYTGRRFNYYPDYSDLPTVKMARKELPPRFLVGLVLIQRLLGGAEFQFGVDNLLDVKVADQFGNSLEDRDYPLPGRQFALALKVQP